MVQVAEYAKMEESRDYYSYKLPQEVPSNFLRMFIDLTPKSDCIVVRPDFDKIVDEKVSSNQVSKDFDRRFVVETAASSGREPEILFKPCDF